MSKDLLIQLLCLGISVASLVFVVVVFLRIRRMWND